MKKLFLTAALLTVGTVATAQQDGQQPNDDQIQQQAPRETQVQMERAARIEAIKTQSNSEIEAEKAAKDKGQSQKQTKTQPVGLNPSDTVAKPKPLKPKKIQSEDSKRRN
ncbi:hypothetical protein [Flavobacterium sp.]|uniref:hypothetical protein n=1 Tax=Flavobacterium sp. TaxID=239 RepID=UPI0039E2BE45